MNAASLTLAEAVGQLICPTLFGAELRDRPFDAARAADWQARWNWGGYIVFHEDQATMRDRIVPLQALSPYPLLIAADLEHGAGQQVLGRSTFPSAMAFGAANDPALAFALGAWTAREALAAGVNWVLAPVADLAVNPANPIIGVRSFGAEPEQVGALVAAFVEGCQSQGAIACVKHFPGHGDTDTDSHSGLATVRGDAERLESVEWKPFAAAIASGVASVMSAHLALPGLGLPDRPATLERAVMTGVLREQLGFGGLVVTDALLMGGIEKHVSADEAGVLAIAAGCDMLLMPRDPAGAHRAIVAAVHSGFLPEARVYEAAERVLAAKARLGTVPAPLPAGSPAEVAEEVALRAMTLARGDASPLRPENTLAISLDDGVEPDRLDSWQQALEAAGFTAPRVVSALTPEAAWEALATESESAAQVLIALFSPIRVSKDRAWLPGALAEPLRAIASRAETTVVSFGSPWLVGQFPDAARWVLAYGARPVQLRAAARALATGSYPGRAPVTLLAQAPDAPADGDIDPPSGPSFA